MAVRLRSSSGSPSLQVVPAGDLHPNPWNPNRMTAFMYAKAIESIREFGFIDPITAFRHEGKLVIIDGEHRWRAGMDLGIIEFPVIELPVSLSDARKLTIVLNELHGQADPEKLTDLLSELLDEGGMTWLTEALPFPDDVLSTLLATKIEFPTPEQSVTTASEPNGKERWVEKLLRMPEDVGLMYESALDKARDGDAIKDWQALERILADFLAS